MGLNHSGKVERTESATPPVGSIRAFYHVPVLNVVIGPCKRGWGCDLASVHSITERALHTTSCSIDSYCSIGVFESDVLLSRVNVVDAYCACHYAPDRLRPSLSLSRSWSFDVGTLRITRLLYCTPTTLIRVPHFIPRTNLVPRKHVRGGTPCSMFMARHEARTISPLWSPNKMQTDGPQKS